MLILLPHVIWQIIQTASNPSRWMVNSTEHPGFIETKPSCNSENPFMQYVHVFTVVYYYVLSALLVIIAIKSRKIRYAHFKDTNLVNLLIFLLFIIGTLFTTLIHLAILLN